jgi:hypothetical protein
VIADALERAYRRALVNGDYDQALETVKNDNSGDEPWTVERLRQALDTYHTDHEHLCLDQNARNVRHTYVIPSEDKRHWRIQQMLVDPEEHNDWVAEFEVDLAQSRATGEPVLQLRRIGPLV